MDEPSDSTIAATKPFWILLYIGVTDPSRFTSEKISEKEMVRRVHRVLDGVLGVPVVLDAFTIKDPPKEVCESSQMH